MPLYSGNREIRDLPVPPPMETRILLWSNPYTLSILILLLTLFWIGRKLIGTILDADYPHHPGMCFPSLPSRYFPADSLSAAAEAG